MRRGEIGNWEQKVVGVKVGNGSVDAERDQRVELSVGHKREKKGKGACTYAVVRIW